MRVDVEVNGRKISALSVEERSGAAAPEVVLDCRKTTEIPADEVPLPDGVRRVRLPMTAQTLSEQDLEQVRREFARSGGPFQVVSQTGWRAATVVLAHAGRVLGWKPEEALARCPGLEARSDLAGFLGTYLTEHADRSERRDGDFPTH